jgi:2-haloacid dehalogenase/putative hydrolase of the HAD superfamily
MSWPKALLLDFYGTVVLDDDAALTAICEKVALVAAQDVSAKDVASYWWRQFTELFQQSHGDEFRTQVELDILSLERVLDHFCAPLDAKALISPLFTYWETPEMWPEAREVLEQCDLPICLVSNIDNAELAIALQRNNLTFQYIVTSEDCRAYKPHPAPFMRALELLGLEPHELLHVGDSLTSDVRGAQALGIPTLWINRTGRKLPEDCSPEYVATDLYGLLSVCVTAVTP